MKVAQLLAELSEQGVQLRADGDHLRIRAPKGVMTTEMRDLLVKHKAELVLLLRQHTTSINATELPLVPVSRERDLLLSFAQQRMWFLSRLQPNNPSYNISVAARLGGLLNVIALEHSFREIVQRHEVLRTTFREAEGEPVQVIASTLNLTISAVNVRHLTDGEREIEIQRLATQEAKRPFDLAAGPLLRVLLLHLEEAEHILVMTMHHIASDGWSMRVLLRELIALYEASCTGQPSPLPDLPIQYLDFAHWQRQWLQGDLLLTQLTYWKQQLEVTPPVLELPTDRPRPAVQTFNGATYSRVIPKSLSEGLTTLSLQSGATLFTTLLAAFQILLYRYTGQDDICTGVPIANREQAEIQGLIGFFVNTLALRTDLSGNPSFQQLLSRVRQVVLGAHAHQSLPFEQLVKALQPARASSYNPLFQVMFVLHNAPIPPLMAPGLTLSSWTVETGTAQFDLTLSMSYTEQGLIGTWEYNTDLFDGSTIERIAAHFQNLLSAIVENPQQAVGELPLLSEAERHQLLVEWNDTAREYPTDKCIHQLFEEQVAKTPHAVAVVFEQQELTYRQLNHKANQLAHYLQTLGVKPEVLVGICVERSVEMVVGILGILKAGGAYVPLDPNYPQERLSYMLADSGVQVLLTHSKLSSSLPSHTARVVCLDTDWGTIEQQYGDNLNAGVCEDNLAYVIYTSGSTGQPKGVAIEHHSL